MVEDVRAGSLSQPSFAAEFVRSLSVPESIDLSNFDVLEVRRRIDLDGYAIVRNLIAHSAVEEARAFWLETYANQKPEMRVTWDPYLGQENTIGFSDDPFQRLFRSCDFLWNSPFEPRSREVCTHLSRLRNVVVGRPLLAGEVFSADRYGVFITTSYYPPNGGWMDVHSDGTGDNMSLVHHVAPLTFKGPDYDEGGMVVIDKKGQTIDVDSQMRRGDVVFYDGSLNHGVRRIVSRRPTPLGRLQMFAIPTRFGNAEVRQRVLEKISYRTLTRSKVERLKRTIRHALGMPSSGR